MNLRDADATNVDAPAATEPAAAEPAAPEPAAAEPAAATGPSTARATPPRARRRRWATRHVGTARARRTYRLALAVAMAFVSIMAAGLALRTALIASDAAHLDSTAVQESVERQRREQFMGLVADQDSRLFATYAQIDASRAGHLAELQTSTDDRDRERLRLEIQAESDLLRATWQTFQAVHPAYGPDGRLAFDAPGTLTQWLATDPRLEELRAGRTVARAEELHAAALLLIADVALLVGALLLLTVAQVWTRPAVAAAAAGAGMFGTVVVLVLAAATDPDAIARAALLLAATVFIPAAVVIEYLVILGTRRQPRRAAADRPDDVLAAIDALDESRSLALSVPTADPAIGDPRRLDSPYARRVAVLIATATLLAAVTAWLQASSSRNAENAAGAAQGHTIEATATMQREVGAAEARIDRVTRYIQATASAANARHAASWYESQGAAAEAASSRREAARWDALAASDPEAAEIAASEFGPSDFGPPAGRDARFPNQLLLQAQHQALVEVGLADAENKRSAAWSAQASAYTAALAVLAVAMYLLGLSLILPAPGVRRPFVLLAQGAMVLVLGVAAIQVAKPPPGAAASAEAELAAANHYAAGDIALSRAFADPSRRDELLEIARRELEAAIVIRPDFALARWDLSTVHIQRGSPQTSGHSTIIDDAACAAASDELRRAQRLELGSAMASWNIGYCALRMGMSRDDRALLDTAEQELAASVRLLPDQGVLHVNLGAARLALGDLDGARAAFADAVEPTIYARVADRVSRPEPAREVIVAAALGELDRLGTWRPELRAETEALKRFIVFRTLPAAGTGAAGEGGEAATFVLENLEAEAFGGLLGWRADLPDGAPPPTTAIISQQWYRLDEASGEWYVLPEISGDVSLTGGTRFQFFANVSRPGSYFNQVTLPSVFSPPRCLDRGTYRIELYAGGEMASTTLELQDRPQVGEVDMLLGVAFCRPEEWSTLDAERGHHVAFLSEDGERGIVALRTHTGAIDQDGLAAFVAARLQREADLFPGRPTPAPQTGEVFNGAWYAPAFFSGLRGIQGYMSVGADRLLSVRAVIDDYGGVVIVGIFGPGTDFETPNEGGLYVMNTVFVFR